MALGSTLTVRFDRPLQPGPLAAENWAATWDDVSRLPDTATAAGSQVDIAMHEDEVDFTGSRCSYAAVPPDVMALAGTPAAAFGDFPIT